MTDRNDIISHLQIMHTWASYDVEHHTNTMTQECFESMKKWTREAINALEQPGVTVRDRVFNMTYGEPETWYYVCGNCMTAIDPADKYCRECGRRIVDGRTSRAQSSQDR